MARLMPDASTMSAFQAMATPGIKRGQYKASKPWCSSCTMSSSSNAASCIALLCGDSPSAGLILPTFVALQPVLRVNQAAHSARQETFIRISSGTRAICVMYCVSASSTAAPDSSSSIHPPAASKARSALSAACKPLAKVTNDNALQWKQALHPGRGGALAGDVTVALALGYCWR